MAREKKESLREAATRNIRTEKTFRGHREQSRKNRQRGMSTVFKKTKGGALKKARAALDFESLTGVGDKTRRDRVLKRKLEKNPLDNFK